MSTQSPSRRHILRGSLAAIGLPFLHSALPRSAWATEAPSAPRRVIWYYLPNGMLMDALVPDTEGPGFATPLALSLAADMAGRFSIISGTSNKAALESVLSDAHAIGTATALSDSEVDIYSNNISNGITADQVIASTMLGVTPFPSLQLGTGEPTVACAGNVCVYRESVSWSASGSPLTSQSSPAVVFEQMFGAGDAEITEAEAQERQAMRTSVLDHVAQRTERLQKRLGRADVLKLDEYLTGVRELEQRITLLDQVQCDEPIFPTPDPGFQQTVSLMNELMVKALQCDLTRVATFMLGAGASTTSYDFLGVTNSHHTLSHYGFGNNSYKADLLTVEQWQLDQAADLARQLNHRIESDGSSLLDNTLLMCFSELEDPNDHTWNNMPLVVFGGEAAGYQQGWHRRLTNAPQSNLWLTAMDFMGVDRGGWGKYAVSPISLM